jgi:4-amino-4-deoxy-L-arabinose transferase-like glycosyltransferase
MWLLIALGVLARIWQFGQIPTSLYWDEVAIGLDSRSLLATGKDLVGHSWLQPLFYSYGDYKAPVYIWLVTFLGKIFNINEGVIRLPSLVAGLGLLWLVYDLVKRVEPKNKKLPRLALASLAVMPWAMHFSRIGFESHLSLFWLALMVWLAVKKSYWAGLAGILGIYSYINLRFLAPVLFLVFAYRQGLKYWFTGLIILAAGSFWLINSPNYVASQQYRLSNDNIITAPIGKVEKASRFLSNYFDFFESKFLLAAGDANLRHHSGFGGELLLVQGLLVIIGLTVDPNRLMVLWLLLAPAVAALVNETPHASRAIYMIVPLAYLAGLGWQKLGKNKFLSWLLVVVLTVNWLIYLHDYFVHYPSRSAFAWIKPYTEAAKKQYDRPVYISPKLYKPELYFAFYQNDLSLLKSNDKFHYYLLEVCPEGAVCIDQF